MASAAFQYCAQVNKHLTCPSSLKRPFLRQLWEETACFCEDADRADLQTLCEQFGSPAEVAEEFLSELGQQTVERCVTRRKKILCATLAIVAAALIAAGALGIQSRQLQQKLSEEEFIASITYNDESDGSFFRFPFQDTIFGHNRITAE